MANKNDNKVLAVENDIESDSGITLLCCGCVWVYSLCGTRFVWYVISLLAVVSDLKQIGGIGAASMSLVYLTYLSISLDLKFQEATQFFLVDLPLRNL